MVSWMNWYTGFFFGFWVLKLWPLVLGLGTLEFGLWSLDFGLWTLIRWMTLDPKTKDPKPKS